MNFINKYVFYKSLVGDSADNIKGVTGIGKKRATNIVNNCACFDDLICKRNELLPKKLSLSIIDEKENGAGPLFDVATHALDTLLYMMDNYEPRMVVGVTYDKLKNKLNNANPYGNWDPEKYTVEDSAFGFVTMKNGASILVECSWLLNTLEATGVKYLMCGTEAGADNFTGALRINTCKNNRLTIETPDLGSSTGISFFEGKSTKNTDLEMRNFIDALEGKAELVNTPERAKVVTDILDAIKISSKTGVPVYFD